MRLAVMMTAAVIVVVSGSAQAQAHKTAAEYEAEADAILAKLNAQHPGAMGVKTAAATTPRMTLRTVSTPAVAAGGGGIVAGRYTCIAGFRPMLTLGEMIISGGRYRFHAPTGADTSGGYSVAGGAIRWSGDIGVIKNNRIVKSGFDAHQPDFYFEYYAYDGAKLPTTAACQKL